MSGHTNKEIAQRADIAQDALGRLMRGEAWGSLPIIVRLEQALEAGLWRGKHHADTRGQRAGAAEADAPASR